MRSSRQHGQPPSDPDEPQSCRDCVSHTIHRAERHAIELLVQLLGALGKDAGIYPEHPNCLVKECCLLALRFR